VDVGTGAVRTGAMGAGAMAGTGNHAAFDVFFGLKVLEVDFLFTFFCCHLIFFSGRVKCSHRTAGSSQQCGSLASDNLLETRWGAGALVLGSCLWEKTAPRDRTNGAVS